MTRRIFIKLSGITAAIAVAPWLASCSSRGKWSKILSLPQVLGSFCDKKELISIGQLYRHDYPNEADGSTLQNLLLTDSTGIPFEPKSEESVSRFLKEKIVSEFSRGDLAIVRGWVLAKIEARQAALYSILNS